MLGQLYEVFFVILSLSGLIMLMEFFKVLNNRSVGKKALYTYFILTLIGFLGFKAAGWERLHEDCLDASRGLKFLEYASYEECVDLHYPEWHWGQDGL